VWRPAIKAVCMRHAGDAGAEVALLTAAGRFASSVSPLLDRGPFGMPRVLLCNWPRLRHVSTGRCKATRHQAGFHDLRPVLRTDGRSPCSSQM